MGKYFGLVIIGALLLAGCAAGEPEAAAPTVTVTATPEAAPIQAAPIEASPTESQDSHGVFGNPEDDEFFVKSIEFAWRGERPTDEQFVSAAKLACEQMEAGATWDAVTVTSGAGPEDDAWNNQHLGQYADQIYCPGHRG